MKGVYHYTKKRKLPPMWTDDPAKDALDYDEYVEWENDQNEDIEGDIADMIFNERYER